jgi:hypothetical protein
MNEETVRAPATKTRARVGPAGRQYRTTPRKPALSSRGTACRPAKPNYRNREEGSRETFARRPAAGDQS